MSTRPSDISAEYKGEWIVTERDFSITAGNNSYKWTVEAEVPAMRYYVGEENSDEYSLGVADWIDDEKPIKFGPDAFATKKSEALSPLNTALEVSRVTYHRIPSDPPPWERRRGVNWGNFSDFTDNLHPLASFTGQMVISYAAGRALVKTLNYIDARDKAKRAAERARRDEARAARRAKKPPMPGWPAINFRRGKKGKGKGASATKKAQPSLAVEAIIDDEESVASFEMADGTIKELNAKGLSVALKIDGKRVWSTETLFIPTESGTKVPGWAYIMAYSTALSREIVSYYNEFVVEKPTASPENRGIPLFALM